MTVPKVLKASATSSDVTLGWVVAGVAAAGFTWLGQLLLLGEVYELPLARKAGMALLKRTSDTPAAS